MSLRSKPSGVNLRTRTEKIILYSFFVVFLAYALTLIMPMIWTAYNSLKDARSYNEDAFKFPAFSEMEWSNYVNIFDEQSMTVSIPFAIFNTVWRSVGTVSLGIFFSACTSYVVCKYADHHRWLNWVYAFVVTIMIIPVLGATATSYNLIHNELQMANKPWLIWTSWCSGIGFGFLMQYSGWKSLSWSYAEAAFMDGASHFQVFWRIMLPMIKPIMSALFVVNFISAWGEYMDTVMYMDEWPSLGYMIYALQNQARFFGMPLYFAVIVVSMIPTLAIFVAFQETIMKNMTTGGLKG
ncbi:MAG: carbohydrate ABC transporter permease [Oscillospiraceae bacterium]|nr:carbohydrate ABC transporter permease [Oscillospiraceae bacterium]